MEQARSEAEHRLSGGGESARGRHRSLRDRGTGLESATHPPATKPTTEGRDQGSAPDPAGGLGGAGGVSTPNSPSKNLLREPLSALALGRMNGSDFCPQICG